MANWFLKVAEALSRTMSAAVLNLNSEVWEYLFLFIIIYNPKDY